MSEIKSAKTSAKKSSPESAKNTSAAPVISPVQAQAPFGNIVTASATKQIAEQLRQAILSGELKKDDRLPTEFELAAQFDVSRPTIREALKRLAAQNLIRSKRGPAGGTFVNGFEMKDATEFLASSTMLMISMGAVEMENIIQTRKILQAECCKLALQNWSDTYMAGLNQCLDHQQDSSISDSEFCAADVAFHRYITDATENPMLQMIVYSIIDALVPVMNMTIVRLRSREKIIGFHQQICQAFSEQNQDQLLTVLNELLDYLNDTFNQQHEAKQQ
ncbi:FadR/GntR family transcriptional regulator [Aliamphritea spongicola]|uniref:FadR/GntR family transcriptional regulator n=1 Tax=Aliamphritea spongicola TaxID=707589 RepID=UPI00196B1F22|nr:GntR family transcriptional regulator [Aliamphritea spongicola]MBN3562535.1 FadR family transcriptional regulator [Aliamphritea spongicola]